MVPAAASGIALCQSGSERVMVELALRALMAAAFLHIAHPRAMATQSLTPSSEAHATAEADALVRQMLADRLAARQRASTASTQVYRRHITRV